MKAIIDLSNVDWKLLRMQKQHLIEVLSVSKEEIHKNSGEGLLALLDDIQDQAAEQLGEKIVFGKEKAI